MLTYFSMQGFPGQIHANIGTVVTNVPFELGDCSVTLLKHDRVLINLLLDTMKMKRRATNVKPKVPFTFSYTQEKREQVRSAQPAPSPLTDCRASVMLSVSVSGLHHQADHQGGRRHLRGARTTSLQHV